MAFEVQFLAANKITSSNWIPVALSKQKKGIGERGMRAGEVLV
ncbi:hypothetical protein COO91_09640 (plasmid) [Nostoc flagelliforme CCNUN1]|uniref:Uncharacterized protein n=1 Tax=Nostoc flagelliforme CCNUN1 TaxID=2038116 RepID=A0A2K8T729_9NOSO|nr:hypothetical protein COO91_09640 [Nostoc flagelliforme CCNUN1]